MLNIVQSKSWGLFEIVFWGFSRGYFGGRIAGEGINRPFNYVMLGKIELRLYDE